MNINKILNKIAGGGKGNILKVRFSMMGKDFEAYVPDDELWGVAKDILINREYEYLKEFELSNFKNGIIVDAGANVGLFSLVASNFAKRVIAIEAHPLNYKLLEINIFKNKCHNVTALNKALVGKNEPKIKIYEGSHTGGASIMAKSDATFYEISTITLKEIVQEYGAIDLLKMDIEGAEFDVFSNVTIELKRIKALVGEIHLNYGNIGLIIQKLKNAGFKVLFFNPPLTKKGNSKSIIKLYGFYRLKILKSAVYTLTTLLGIKDESLAMLYALRV